MLTALLTTLLTTFVDHFQRFFMYYNILELIQNDGIYPAKVSSTNGGEYASSCPGCGGHDRFRSWPNTGRWWCRQCDLRGDEIEYLKRFRGMTFKEASNYLGVEKIVMSQTHQKQKQNIQSLHYLL